LTGNIKKDFQPESANYFLIVLHKKNLSFEKSLHAFKQKPSRGLCVAVPPTVTSIMNASIYLTGKAALS
jgi:hypothetical protein